MGIIQTHYSMFMKFLTILDYDFDGKSIFRGIISLINSIMLIF